MGERTGRPLIIGESPSKAGDRYRNFPLSGAPAKFLCAVAGLEVDDEDRARGVFYWALIAHVDTANSVHRWPGSRWPAEEARERVSKLVEDYDVVVLMGKRAQEAYPAPMVARLAFFEWYWDHFGGRWVVAIPHSSGLNRIYNNPDARKSAGRVLNEAIEKAREAA